MVDQRSQVPEGPVRALAARDDRSFLVRAIDRAFVQGALTVVDVDLLELEVVRMALAYLAKHRWRATDIGDVRDAAAIVCMYVNDGLMDLSDRDVDRAARILTERGVKDCYRASGAAVERDRAAIAANVARLRIAIGSAHDDWTCRATPPGLPETIVGLPTNGIPTDRDILNACRNGGSIAEFRTRMRRAPAYLERWAETLAQLPWQTVAAAWRSIAHADAFRSIPDGEFNCSRVAWTTALVVGVVHDAPTLVMTPADVRAFTARAVEGTEDGRRFVSHDAIAHATAQWCAWLPRADHAIIADALAHTRNLSTHVPLAVGDRPIGAWGTEWALNAFLVVTDAERAALLNAELGADDDNSARIVRLETTLHRGDRSRILAAIDVTALSMADLLLLLDDAAEAPAVLARVAWRTYDHASLAQLFDGAAPTEVVRMGIPSLLAQRSDIAEFPPSLLHAIVLAVIDDPKLLAAFLAAWQPTSNDLIRNFREALGAEMAHDWLDVAIRLPGHFAALLHDAVSFTEECERIRSYLAADAGGRPRADPDAFIACVRIIERAARRRAPHGPLAIRDADLRTVTATLHPMLRERIRHARTQRSQRRARRPA